MDRTGERGKAVDAGRQQGVRSNASDRQNINRSQISARDRRRVRSAIFKDRVARISRARAGFAIRIGAHVPRRHHLHRLGANILAFAPFYAGYEYVVVDDVICIVDPATYVIVDVIPADIQEAGVPPLVLSAGERQFVRATVPSEGPRADLNIRLALGATIPDGIQLGYFPADVLATVPQLDGYRYLLVEADIVIIDPADRSVALVLTD